MALKPGHYRYISNDDYHADPSVSKSKLDVIGKGSPLHYFDRYLAVDREPFEPTRPMVLGNALHVAVLEPDDFGARYAVGPKVDRRYSAGKAEWAAFAAENIGKVILDSDERDIVIGQRDSVFRCKPAWELFANAEREGTYVAMDPDTGLMVRARPDAFDRKTAIVADLKRTIDASQNDFGRSAATYRYDVQAGWYPYVMNLASRVVVQQFRFVCVEATRPYAVGIYQITPEDFVAGLGTAKRDLRLIADCTATNHWPDYAQIAETVRPLELPVYYKRNR